MKPLSETVAGKFQQAFKELPENWVIALETVAEDALEVWVEAMKTLTGRGYHAIVLSTTRPCVSLLSLFAQNKVDTSQVMVLCACCKSLGSVAPDNDQVAHVDSVSALTQISIVLTQTIVKLAGLKSFFFLDSLSTLLIHNEPKTLARFVHGTLIRLRLHNVSGLLIMIPEDMDKEIRAELAQLCDKIVRI